MGIQKEWNYSGLLCRVLDSPFGSYNGYVAVPKEHPAWGQDYETLPIEVHGGLTFGQQGSDDPEKSEDFPNTSLYWFGFDTSHAGDWVDFGSDRGGRKWTAEDVAKETEGMAKQFSVYHGRKGEGLWDKIKRLLRGG